MRTILIITLTACLSLASCLALKGVERKEESSAAGPTTNTGDDSPVTNITFQSVGGSAGWALIVPMAWLAWRNRVGVRTVDRYNEAFGEDQIKTKIVHTDEFPSADAVEKLIVARLRKAQRRRRSSA